MDIFISYRRQDTSGYALGIRRELKQRLPDAHVFLDVESLDAGVKWRDVIRERIGRCDLMLVLIGDEWWETRDGRQKMLSPDDPVRLELQTGLGRPEMNVIPVLLEGASMPSGPDLPEVVRELCEYGAHAVHDKTYDRDLNALLDLIDRLSADCAGAAKDEEPLPPPEPEPEAGTAEDEDEGAGEDEGEGDEEVGSPVDGREFPARITAAYLARELPAMTRPEVLALLAEVLRRGWSHENVYEWTLGFSPLKPPRQLPNRITTAWLEANVPLLSPRRIERLVAELRRRAWSEAAIREHVYGNRPAGLAARLPERLAVAWLEQHAPLMNAEEQDLLAGALVRRGWSEPEIRRYAPVARLPY